MRKFNRKYYRHAKEPGRDKIGETVNGPISRCVICGEQLHRKKNETAIRFRARKTCGNIWNGEKLLRSECLRAYQSGKGNPNYKGLMDRKCAFCGKKGLSYGLNDKGIHTKMHKECYDKFRQQEGFVPYNKKEDPLLFCYYCGKRVASRFSNGRLRQQKGKHVFCSKTCANRCHNGYKGIRMVYA